MLRRHRRSSLNALAVALTAFAMPAVPVSAAAPTVDAVRFLSSPQSGDTYGVGERITVEVKWSESVTVTGSPRLALTVGSKTLYAEYAGGVNPRFRYTVGSRVRDLNGVSVAAGALELNGGAIRSESTNENADTGLGGHAITDDSSHKVDGSIAVAAIVTAVRIATRPTGGRAYFRTGERIRVEVRFGKPVSASSIVRPRLALSIGAATRQVSAAASSGYSEFLTFDYTVQSGDYDADGFSIAAGALTLGRVVDRGGRAANLNLGRHAISGAAGYRVNNAPPSFGSATVTNRKFDTDTPIAPLVLPEATGEGTLSYTLTPSTLPQGLTWTSATRTISGTPTAVTAARTYTWKATDSEDETATLTFTIAVAEIPSFGSAAGPALRYEVNQPIASFSLPAAAGGDGALTYALGTTPALPEGLSYTPPTGTASGGVIAGTPTEATAERTYTLTATDTDGDAATLAFTIRVVNHPVVSEVRIMDWSTNGVYYSGEEIRIFVGFSSSITVWGNTDLAIVIGGQTRRAGRHSFNTTGIWYSYTVQDSDFDTDGISIPADAHRLTSGVVQRTGTGQSVDMAIGGLAVTDAPDHRVGSPRFATGASVPAQSYTQRTLIDSLTLPSATGVATPLTYALGATPALPAGLTYTAPTSGNNHGGVIAGTPTAALAQTTYTFSATDTNGRSDSLTFTITVDGIPTFGDATVANQSWVQRRRIAAFTLPAAVGGDGVLTYALSPSLPGGVTRDAATHMVSGAPSTSQTATTYTWAATDADGDKAELTFTIEVEGVPAVTLATADSAIAENGGTTTVTATLSHAWGQAMTVTVTPVAGSYTVGQDATIVIAAGSTANASDSVTITAVNDDLDNVGDRSVTVSGTAGSARGAGSVTGASLTLTDDEATPTATLVLSPASIAEGAWATVAVTLDRASSEAVTLTVSAAAGANASDGDFTLSSTKTLAIAAGSTSSSGTVTIAATRDTSDSPDKEVTVSASVSGSSGIAAPASRTLTITDDGPPTVTLALADSSISENGGTTTVSATLTSAWTSEIVVTVSGLAGAYAVGADTTIAIPAGQTQNSSDTVTVTAVDNATDEPDRSVTVAATAEYLAPGSLTRSVGVSGAALTLEDDDAAPYVTVQPSTLRISENGGTADLSATASHPSSAVTKVTISVAPSSRAPAGDYVLSRNRVLTIAAGATTSTGTVTIAAVDNDRDEPDRWVVLRGTPQNSQGASQYAGLSLAIDDDEAAPVVTLAVADGAVDEDGGTTTVTATLSHASSEATTITVTALDGAYTVGTDATIVIAAGATSNASDTAAITAVDDDVDNVGNRTVTVTATAVNSHDIGTVTGASLTLTDDEETPAVTLALSEPDTSKPDTIAESGSGNASTVTATLSGTSSEAVTLTVAAAPGANTVEGDFTLSSAKTLTIAAGSTVSTGTVTVTAVDDTRDAPDKSVTVSAAVSGSSGVAAPADATLTITDDDDPPAVSISSPSVSEGAAGTTATLRFEVTLGTASGRQVTVGYAESATGRTATPGTDYTALASGTLTIAAGDTSGVVAVTVIGDGTDEPDEKVKVVLSGPVNATLGTATGTGTITDDEAAPAVTLAVADGAVDEDGGTTTVTATLSHASSEATTITVTALDGAYTVGTDATIVIAAGATSNASDTAAITAVDDDVDNVGNRSVTVTATAVNSHDVGTVTGASLTLTDDEETPAVTLALSEPDTSKPDTIAESGSGNASTVTATLSGTSSEAVTLTVAAAPGANTVEGDFTLSSAKTLTIAAGSTASTGAVTVTAVDDTKDAPDKSVMVSAAVSGSSGVAAPADATLTIADDDTAPAVTLALAAISVPENGGSTTVTATLSHPSSAVTTVTVTAVSGAYTVGSDTTIVIAAGETANAMDTAAITAVDNEVDAADNAVTVVGTAANAQAAAESETMTVAGASLTITDDDTAGLVVSPSTSASSRLRTTEDGGTATFTVKLGSEPTGDVVLGVASSDTTEGTVSASSLTFTATTWSTAQTVTLTGVDDAPANRVDGDRRYTVTLTVNPVSTADRNYDALSAITVYAVNADNEYGLDVGSVTGQATEAGGTAAFTVALLTRPSAAVTVSVTSLDASEGAASPSSLTFQTSDWNTAQTVTVTGADDAIDDGDVAWDVRLDPSSGDTNYNGLANVDVSVTTTDDDDAPGVVLAVSPASIAENGGTATVTAALSHPSGAATTVTVTAVPGFYTVGSDAVIVIAAGETANATDTAAVAAVDNAKDEPDRAGTVTATVSNDRATADGTTLAVSGGALTVTDDDDAPNAALSLNPASVSENGGASAVSATLTHPSSEPTTVTVSPVSGAYTVGSDAVIVIAAGETANATDTAAIAAVDNAKDEPDRTATVTATLTNSQGAGTVSGAALTLEDDDDAPGLSIDSPSVDEGDSGSVSLEFTVSLSAASGRQVTVGYADAGTGTAASGTDYTAISAGTLTFAAGETAKTLTVLVTGDTTDEPDETVVVSLSGAANAAISTASGTGTITDDDATPTVTLSLSEPDASKPDTVNESGAGNSSTVTATLSGRSSAEVILTVAATAGANAVAGDFTLSSAKTLTIAAGSTVSTGAVTVTAVDDTKDAPDKSVTVTATVSGTSGVAAPSSVTLTITDDDDAPGLSIDSPRVDEGDSGTVGLEFTVSLSAASGRQVTVGYADAGTGTAASGTDYTAISAGTLTFAAGETAKTLTVLVTGDTTDEPDETVVVSLSGAANAAISTASGTGTITDDDATPTVTLSLSEPDASKPDTVNESGAGNSSTVTATLSGRSSAEVILTVAATAGANAVAGDFTLSSAKTLTIAAGSTVSTGAVTVTAVDDTKDAPDKSVTVSAVVSGSSGVAAPSSVTLTITDDDDAPGLSIDSPSVDEGDSGTASLEFTVSLSAASGRQVTVGYADAGTGTAASGTDYTAISAGTLTFAAGETAKTLTVSVTGDTTDEPDETVVVSLSGAANAAISTASGTGTITDDDATPTVTLSLSEPDASKPDTVNESGAGNSSTVTATLSGPSSEAVTLTVAATAGANAVAGDFTLSSDKTLTIAAGSTASTGTVTVTAVDDTKDAPDKEVTVTATVSGTSGVAAPSSVTLTITDDDDAPGLSIDSPRVDEGDSGTVGLEFTVSLGAASGRQVTVGYADAGTGTATSGTDYTAISAGTLTFAAGETAKTLTVSVTGDTTDEPGETVVVSLSGAANAAISTASGTGTITDDDATPTVTLSLSEPYASKPDTVNESGAGNSSTVTATLSGRSSAEVILTVAATAGANAVAGDFTLSSAKTLTIASGSTASAGTVTVTAVDDTKDAPDKEVTVTATVSGTSGVAAPSSVTLTITDDDDAPAVTLAVVDSSISENGGSTTVTATLSHPSSADTAITVTASAGTGAVATDFTQTGATLTVAAGATRSTGTVTVTAVDDTTDSPDKEVTISGSAVNAQGVGAVTGTTLTITDDEGLPTVVLVVLPSSVSESGGVSTVTATLSGASSEAVTVTVGAAAVAPAVSGDFTLSTANTLTIASGSTASTGAVTVTAVGNAADAPDKAVTVSGTVAGGNGVAAPSSVTLTITDDDAAPEVLLSVASSSIPENGGSTTVSATLTHPSSAATTVTVTPVSGAYTVGSDAVIVIAAGSTASATDTATITAVDNAVDAADSDVTLMGTAANTQATAESETMTVTGASLTITDDDTAGLVVSPSTSASSRLRTTEDGGTAAFEVKLGSEPTGDVVLGVASSDTAEGTVSASSLTFTATTWSTAQTVTLTGVDDAPANRVDGDRRYTVTLTVNPVSTADRTYDALSAITVYAVNADNEYGLDVGSVTGQATEAGGQATFTVALLTRPSAAVTVSVTSLDASEGAASPSSLTFTDSDWNTTQTVTVTGADDAIDDGDVTWNVRLAPSSGDANYNGLSNVDVLVTTTDDDDAPNAALSLNPASVSENGGASVVSVRLTHPSSAATTVTVTPVSGFYTVGSDAVIVIAAGETADATDTATIAAVDDDVHQGSGGRSTTVTATLTNSQGAGTVSGATLTLTDDETLPTVTLALSPSSISESGGVSTVTATLSGTSSEAVTVTVGASPVTSTGAMSGDFTLSTANTLTIASGSTASTGTVTVTAVDDTKDAPDKEVTVTATVSGTSGVAAPSSVTLTITDDDAAPSLSIDSPRVGEGDSGTASLEFTVSLGAASGRQVTVGYVDAGTGTATSGTDYTAISAGTLTFAAGETAKTLTVTVTGDTTDEPDETVVVSLSGSANAAISTASGTGTITDDDATPTVTLALSEPDASKPDTVNESGAGNSSTVTATLSGRSSAEVILTVAATAGANAVAGDFTLSSAKTLTIASGSTASAGTVTVTAVDDTKDAPDKSVTVTATVSGTSGVAAPPAVTLTITDDDAAPGLSIDSPRVGEGDSGTVSLEFTVSLSAASGRQVTVGYVDAGTGTATSGTDYTAISAGTLTFAAGETAKTLTVTVTGDTTDEPDETVVVSLSGSANAAISTASGTGTITDDDAAPSLSIDSPRVGEGDSGTASLEFTVSLGAASGRQVTVGYVDAGTGTATSGTDYTAISAGTLTFAAGETAKTLTVLVTGDTTDEPDETVVVSLSGAANAAISTASGTGTITDDDDAPSLSIDSPRVGEGDSGTASLEFTVSLGAASGRQVTVGYADAGTGTATSGTDYTAISAGTLTFAAGETAKTLTVLVTGDTTDEPDETVVVSLSGAANAAISTASGTGTITDDDDAPSLSIDSPRVGEGDSGTASLEFTVSLGAASGRQVTVGYADAGTGTATSGTDYTAISAGTLTFAAGETAKTLTVLVTGDTTDEPDETVVVSLSGAANAAISTASGTGTITDDDGEPSLSIDSPSVGEGDSGTVGLEFTVSLGAASGRQVTVGYADAGTGTATSGTDYTAISAGTLTFAAGETAKTLTVLVTGDTTDEPDETVVVSLSGAANAAISTASGTGTITDDDGEPSLSIDSPSVGEGDSGTVGLEFTVSLGAASGRQVTVGYADAGTGTATSGTDYTAISAGTLTFAAGETAKTLTVSVTGDTTDEPDETVVVGLSGAANAAISTASGTGTITDDDGEPSLSIDSPRVGEGDSGTVGLEFTVSLGAASGRQVTVGYADAGTGTATPGTDYTAISAGTLTFAAGETAKTLTVLVTGDTTDEPDETVVVSLSGAANAAISTASGTGTITDDDGEPSLSIDSPSVGEGDSGTVGLEFTVSLGAASGRQVTVGYADAGTGTATSGTDYTAISAGTLTFAAGETAKTLTVLVTGDTTDEPDETVVVSLSGSANAAISTASGTGTITDDDGAPSLSIDSPRVGEGDSGTASLEFTVSLGAASGRQVTVGYADAGTGTATSGTDYTAISAGTLTFAAGETAKTLTVSVTGDTTDEPDETVVVSLSGAANAAISTASGTGTITDDDGEPSLSIDSPRVGEGDSGTVSLEFTVSLGAASGRQVTVGYADAGTGTAASGTDYTAISAGTLTFAAGETAKTLTVSVTGDTTDEPDETVVVSLSGSANAAISTASGTGTITDDDATPAVTLALSEPDASKPDTVNESGAGNSSTVTATLSGPSSEAVTLTVAAAPGANAVAGDFTLSSAKTLTIASGSTASAGTVTVTAVDDTKDAPDKSVTVTATVSGTSGVAAPPAVTLTITDDDDAPGLSIDSPRVGEGDSGTVSLEFTVSLGAASGRQVTVGYADAGTGTATSGTDYTALASGTLTFVAGETSRTLTVTVTGDTTDEPDETVVVGLSGAANAAISTASGTGTITDDDDAPGLSIDSPRVGEGDSGTASLEFTVSLGAASGRQVTVGYADAGTGTATSGTDYTAISAGTLTFAAGETAKTLTVSVTGDTTDEPDETVVVGLSGAANAAISTASGAGTITDDDGEPGLSIDSPRVGEGDSGTVGLEFTVSLGAASGRQVTVGYADAGTGTATSGTDYTAISAGTLTFAAGETAKTLTVLVTGDTTDEPDETVVVSLSGAANAAISTASGTGTITDDDGEPSLSIDSPSVGEGDSGTVSLEFTVSLGAASGRQVTVGYADAGTGTATPGTDYTAISAGTLTFAAGETAKTLTVLVTGDTTDEPDETVVVSLSGAANAAISTVSGTGTITNDDATPAMGGPSADAGDEQTVAEGVVVTLDGSRCTGPSGQPGAALSYAWAQTAGSPAVTLTGADTVRPSFTAPQVAAATTLTFTLTVTAGGVSASDTVRVTVTDEPPRRVDSTPSFGDAAIADKRWKQSTAVTAFTLPTASGGDGALAYALSPQLPEGLAFDADTRMVTGAPVEVMAETQYTWTATDADGDEAALAFSITVVEDLIPVLTETVSDQLYWVGAAIDALELPAASGGDGALAYALSPHLPEGLAFDADTRMVTGAPVEVMAETQYTWTATDGDGDEAALAFSITVVEDLIPEFTETVSDQLYWVGAAIDALELPAASGGDGALAYALSPQLPEGLAFDADTRMVTGTPVEVMAETEYTWTATDGDGDTAMLSFRVEVAMPVKMSMEDGQAEEGEAMMFMVELSPPPPRPMEVKCVTMPGTATIHEDYVHLEEHWLSIAAGQHSVRVVVATIDDEKVEPEETFTVSLVPEWAVVERVSATGTILDNDAAAARARALKVMLASFGREVAQEAVEVVGERLGEGASGSHVTLAGQRMVLGPVSSAVGEEAPSGGFGREALHRREVDKGRIVSAREIVSDSAFAVSFGVPEEAGSDARDRWTVWGRTGRSEFSGRPEGELSAQGKVLSGYVGLDARVRDDLVLGVALSHSEGDMSYERSGAGGEVDARLTSVLPYGRWTAGGGLSVWGLLSAGWGEVELVDDLGATRTGIGLGLLALGWRQELEAWQEVEWALKGDGFMVEVDSEAAWMLPATRAGVQRLRLMLEGGREWSVAEHGRLRTKVEFGGRWDGGDAQRGYGSEVGGSLEYVDSRLGVEIEGRGRYVLGHESQGFRTWGASLGVRVDPGGDGEGVWIGLSPVWGAPHSGVQSLWEGGPQGGGSKESSSVRMALEAGYRSGDALDVRVTVDQERAGGASSPVGVTLRTHLRW